uniref:Uncharacterized protein n=1 Tax=Populus trichocarpa TaxID=3694 RepID=A0A2K2AN76_POPTR
MASLQASSFLLSCSCSTRINAAISVPKLPGIRISVPRNALNVVEELNLRDGFTSTIPIEKNTATNTRNIDQEPATTRATVKLYAILEAVADRVEMHKNVGEQRDNWNKLLLDSINMIILTAATMAGVSAGAPLLALKLSSTLLFSAATGMLLIMNKIQPSQLAVPEEQINATRLFKQLYSQIQTTLALHDRKELDLPLLGSMTEKFPENSEPAIWWPKSNVSLGRKQVKTQGKNGCIEDLEEVIKTKDSEDYMRLGHLALKANKIVAICGPLLTGTAASGSAFVGHGSWAVIVAVTEDLARKSSSSHVDGSTIDEFAGKIS